MRIFHSVIRRTDCRPLDSTSALGFNNPTIPAGISPAKGAHMKKFLIALSAFAFLATAQAWADDKPATEAGAKVDATAKKAKKKAKKAKTAAETKTETAPTPPK